MQELCAPNFGSPYFFSIFRITLERLELARFHFDPLSFIYFSSLWGGGGKEGHMNDFKVRKKHHLELKYFIHSRLEPLSIFRVQLR